MGPGSPTPSLGRRFVRLTFYNILANVTVPLASLVDTALRTHLFIVRMGMALAWAERRLRFSDADRTAG